MAISNSKRLTFYGISKRIDQSPDNCHKGTTKNGIDNRPVK